ncbi:RNA polymerase-associated protein RTF1 homolog [Paramacrobiotus metropolitanus]|uniref:RNA polymerase-associated protein RTF1 homolog n=1 Tax=Paramacrobiotus metropolitanus TaxID=2943436 RepID=UPI0024458705|nr:RNA polymerase-associated protein RTF1 homolog [Paramacrobiotus metropolitanus]
MSDSEREEPEKKRPHSSSDDDAADKDEPIQSRLRAKKARASNIYSSSEEENSDEERRNKSKLKKKSPTKKPNAVSDDDVEEGEVSDRGSSSDEMKYSDGLDDQLLGDEDDKQRLASMTEREREEEIFRRLEHRQALQRRAELEKKLRRRATEGVKGKPNIKAVDETSARSKERRLMVEGKKDVKSKAMDKFKQAREEKRKKDAEQEKKKAASKPSKESDSESDADDDDLPDVERKNVDASSSSDSDSDDSSEKSDKKDDEKNADKETINTYQDLDKIRVERDKLVEWMYLSFFPETMKGCFVKVNFGDVDADKKPIYRIAEIVGVGENKKPYVVSVGDSAKSHHTQLTLRVKVVDREKDVPLNFVSNRPIVETEFNDFLKRLNDRSLPAPTRGHLEKKLRDLDAARAYRKTDEDITRMVEMKKKFANRPQNLAMKKAELVKLRSAALLSQDHVTASRYQAELDELNAQTQQLDAPRLQNQAKIEQINQRNKNVTLKALGDAMNSQQRAEVERSTDDPFTRRWGTPTMVHRKGAAGAAATTAPGSNNKEAEAANGGGAASSITSPEAPNGTATSGKVDPFNMHNFDIGIDIDLGEFPVASLPYRRNK